MKQKLISLILVFCLCLPAIAQHRHEISVNGGAGLSSFRYSYGSSNHSLGLGGKAGVGYHYFFSPQWGIGAGVNASLYNAKTTIESISGSYMTSTPNIPHLQFTYEYTDYEEKTTAMLLNIPIVLQFQTTGKTAFYADLGLAFGIPVNASYTTAGNLTTRGHNKDIDVSIDPDLQGYGFGNYAVDQKTDWALKVAVMLTAEVGAKWRVTNKLNLYTGVYFDYGFNDINKNSTAPAARLITYQPENPKEFVYSGMVTACDKVVPIAAGVTLRLSFGLGNFTASTAGK